MNTIFPTINDDYAIYNNLLHLISINFLEQYRMYLTSDWCPFPSPIFQSPSDCSIPLISLPFYVPSPSPLPSLPHSLSSLGFRSFAYPKGRIESSVFVLSSSLYSPEMGFTPLLTSFLIPSSSFDNTFLHSHHSLISHSLFHTVSLTFLSIRQVLSMFLPSLLLFSPSTESLIDPFQSSQLAPLSPSWIEGLRSYSVSNHSVRDHENSCPNSFVIAIVL